MEPLDLTKHPPRSPRERLDGLVFMPRTVDKLRAMLPGGKSGNYRIAGTSARMLETLGVSEDDILKAVADAKSEEDVAAWLRAHADTSKYAEINERLTKRQVTDVADLATMHERYPVLKGRPEIKYVFEMLDADDTEAFPTHK